MLDEVPLTVDSDVEFVGLLDDVSLTVDCVEFVGSLYDVPLTVDCVEFVGILDEVPLTEDCVVEFVGMVDDVPLTEDSDVEFVGLLDDVPLTEDCVVEFVGLVDDVPLTEYCVVEFVGMVDDVPLTVDEVKLLRNRCTAGFSSLNSEYVKFFGDLFNVLFNNDANDNTSLSLIPVKVELFSGSLGAKTGYA